MLKIYRPLQTDHKTQGWGENKACINYQGKVVTKRGFTCPNGYEDFYKSINMKGHNGFDFACFYKEPIFFSTVATNKDGKAIEWYSKDASDMAGGLGVDVFPKDLISLDVLPSETGPHARKLWEDQNRSIRVKFRFWHFHSGWKDVDVKLGEQIGCGNSTGKSSGNHLHWLGAKFVDANDITLDKNNGYYGAVDFTEWYINQFILDKLGRKPVLTNAQKVYKVAYYFRLPILNEVGKLIDN